MRVLSLSVCLAASAVGNPASAQPSAATAPPSQAAPAVQASYDLRERLRTALRVFDIPGAAVAVIHDGKVTTEVAGVRRLGAGGLVTPQTVFPIGSTTKAFTATLMAMLVDEGKVKWDDKVRQHLPDLRLYDPYVTENITVRDLLGMRSGIANELIWLGSGISRAEVLQRLHAVPPTAGFRERYVYSNINYLLAGQVIEKVTGRPWGAVIEDRIFRPLGMSRSSTTVPALTAEPNSVSSHVTFQGRRQPVPHTDLSAMDGAGAINSTAEDMAKWVSFQFTGLAPDGARLVSEASLRQMHAPQITMSGFNSYGLGWVVGPAISKNKLARLLYHNGSTLAAVSVVAVVPSERLGVVILANALEDPGTYALMLHVIDQYLGSTPKDHIAAVLADRRTPPVPSTPRATVPPPLPLQSYAGVYDHEMMGRVELSVDRGRLVLRRGRWSGIMRHVGNGEFEVEWQEAFTGSFGGTPSLRFPNSEGGHPRRLTFWGLEFIRSGS